MECGQYWTHTRSNDADSSCAESVQTTGISSSSSFELFVVSFMQEDVYIYIYI